MPPRRGFSLVELLVVASVIVVLLALTVAAMDHAIYRAELAVCGSRLHAMAAGALTYATAHRRRYPYRQGVENGDWEAHKIYQSLPNLSPIDDRPITKDYIPLKTSLDPLCQEISIDEGSTKPEDVVFRNSDLWAGFRWFGHQGMRKIGDRMEWTDDVYSSPPRTTTFSLLASDRDFMNFAQPIVDSSHPDDEGLLVSMKWQSGDVSGGFGLLADTVLQATYSGWYRLGVTYRGKSDLNYAYDDGSVQTVRGVLYQKDDRMTPVPHFANVTGVPTVGAWPTQFDNLPRQ